MEDAGEKNRLDREFAFAAVSRPDRREDSAAGERENPRADDAKAKTRSHQDTCAVVFIVAAAAAAAYFLNLMLLMLR